MDTRASSGGNPRPVESGAEKLKDRDKKLLGQALEQLKAQRAQIERLQIESADTRIAIVGYACRFPGSESADSFWETMSSGKSALSEVDDGRWSNCAGNVEDESQNQAYTSAAGLLDGIDQFDARFFGISAVEANALDPQQRMLLETSWHALEHAGIDPHSLRGSSTAVLVGLSTDDYARLHASSNAPITAFTGLGATKSMAAGRIAYFYDLRGPVMQLDTACSSSLVALHVAARELRDASCDLALVSAANAIISPDPMAAFCEMKALSPRGKLSAFEDSADGYVRGEGAACVVLKRYQDALRDGDEVHGVLLGSAIGHDGRTNGLTAPNPAAQEEVIRKAIANARCSVDDVQYVEMHGTGTRIGDVIEANALAAAHAGRSAPLRIGSVKTTIGHLEAAAGLASLIRVLLGMRYGSLPGQPGFTTPNSRIDWANIPLEISEQDWTWEAAGGVRCAGISAFGMSGTNAHVIISEGPAKNLVTRSCQDGAELLLLSAPDEDAMRARLDQYADALAVANPGEVRALAAGTLRAARFAEYRAALPIREGAQGEIDLRGADAASFRATSRHGGIALIFSGHGTAYAGMAAEPYVRWPAFRQALDVCHRVVMKDGGFDLRRVCCEVDAAAALKNAEVVQPALVAMGIALAAQWRAWGLHPAAVMGHSIGEYAAAVAAGSLQVEDAIRLACARGRTIAAHAPEGVMMAAIGRPEDLARFLEVMPEGTWLAALNSPRQATLASTPSAVVACEGAAAAHRLKLVRLDVTYPFHSPLMRAAADAFADIASATRLHKPSIPWMGTCGLAGEEEPWRQSNYFVEQIVQPVGMLPAIEKLSASGLTRFVEIGADARLASAVRDMIGDSGQVLPTMRRGVSIADSARAAHRALFISGQDLQLCDAQTLRAPSLPYPFQRQRFWLRSLNRRSPRTNDPATASSMHGFRLRPLGPDVKACRYEVTIDGAEQPHIAEHRLFGRIVVAGASWIALWLELGMVLLPNRGVEIGALEFLRPLVIEDGASRTISLIGTQNAEGNFELHAEAEGEVFGRCVLRAWAGPLNPCLPAEPDKDASSIDLREFYDRFSESGYHIGPSYQWMLSGQDGKRGAWRQMEAKDATKDLNAYPLFPGLIDASFHALASQLADGADVRHGRDIVVPAYVESIRFAGEALRMTSAGVAATGTGVLQGDVAVYTAEGCCALDIRGLQFRRISSESIGRQTGDSESLQGLVPQWTPSNVSTSVCAAICAWVGAAPTESGVEQATGVGMHVFGHDLGTEELRLALLLELGSRESLDLVLIAQPFPVELARGDSAAWLQQSLAIWRSFLAEFVRSPVRLGRKIHIVLRGKPDGADMDSLLAAAVSGLVCSLAAEHAELAVLVLRGEVQQVLASFLPNVARPEASGEYWLREGRWERLTLKRASIEPQLPAPDLTGAVALITGGTGALAPTLGRWLEACGASDIVYVSRNAVSEDRVDAATGVRRSVVSCDVADEAAVQSLLQGLATAGRSVQVIVHAAGVLADTPFTKLDDTRLAQVLAPKILGAMHLQRHWDSMSLRMVLAISSLASVVGSPYQAAYSAANRALDSWALGLRATGLPVSVVNLGPVDVGMAKRLDATQQNRLQMSGLSLMDVDSVVTAATQAHAQGRCVVYLGRAVLGPTVGAAAAVGTGVLSTNPISILGALCEAMASLLGYSHDPEEYADQPLTQLGTDSLLVAELTAWINKTYRLRMSTDEIQALPSLREIAGHVSYQLSAIEQGGQVMREAVVDEWMEGVL